MPLRFGAHCVFNDIAHLCIWKEKIEMFVFMYILECSFFFFLSENPHVYKYIYLIYLDGFT